MSTPSFKEQICRYAGRESAAGWRMMKRLKKVYAGKSLRKRESRNSSRLIRLDSISYLPDTIFSAVARSHWGKDIIVVPMYFFAMPFDGNICLSREHTDVKWMPYDEACGLIYYQDQKTALYELNERLLRNNLYR